MSIVREYATSIIVTVISFIFFIICVQFEAFELFYEFSRDHEDWDLDEFFSFFVAASVALPILMFQWNRRLRAAYRQKEVAEQHATHISRHDALTGLYNRRYLFEKLARRIEDATSEGTRPAVILLDLDRFKPINDLRGHETGDFILQRVAERIKSVCYEGQEAVRLGGDEFAVLLDETQAVENAPSLARRILAAVNTKYEFPGWSTSMSCSVGIAVWTEGTDGAQLVKSADQAMYKAKREGRARFAFFNEELGEKLREEAELESDLVAAVDAGEFQPYFQPILCIASGSLIGFEVLARWISPTRGNVPPDVFIPLAEDIGLIGPLSWQILRNACIAATSWDDDLTIAFNLSPRQFSDRKIARKIQRILAETGLPGHRLEVEITENAVIEDIESAKQTLEELHDVGIRISLDDFGTGFSSLATLSKLPFDKLKIDKSFISRVTMQPQSAKIVEAIVALASSLDLTVTAEGIEELDELNFLSALNCQHGQGYLFEPPMPRDKVNLMLENGRKPVFQPDTSVTSGGLN